MQVNLPKFCPSCGTASRKKFRAIREGNSFKASCSNCGYVHKPKIQIEDIWQTN